MKALSFPGPLAMLLLLFGGALTFDVNVNSLDYIDAIKFVFFVVTYQLLPAWVLGHYIFRQAPWSGLVRVLVAYPLVIAGHIVLGVLGAVWHATWVLHAAPLISALFFWAGRRSQVPSPALQHGIETGVVALIYPLWIGLFYLLMWKAYTLPTISIPTALHQDHLWNAGNIWALIRGSWSLQDSRVLGQPLTYHLGQSVVHAGAYSVTGIQPYLLQNYYFPPLDALILLGIIIFCGKEVGGFSGKTAVWLAVVLLFTSGYGWYYNGHLFANPLTFFYSLAPLSLLLFIIKSYYDGVVALEKFYIGMLYFVLVAIKSLLALIILPAMGAVLLFEIARGQRKEIGAKLALGFGMVLATLLVKEAFFSAGQRGVYIGTKIAESRIYHLMEHALGQDSVVLTEALFGVYLVVSRIPVLMFSAAGIAIVVMVVLHLYKEGNSRQILHEAVSQCWRSSWLLFLLALVVVATIERYFIQYEEYAAGASIYFEWYPMWIIPFLAAYVIDRMKPEIVQWCWLWAVCILGVAWTGYSKGLLITLENSSLNQTQVDIRATLSADEFRALEWLRHNSPSNAVVASDRRAFRGVGKTRDQSRFFAYSAISGRQMLLEGEDYLGGEARARSIAAWERFEKQVTEEDTHSLCQDLSKSGAQYFFQSLRFERLELETCLQLLKVYRNNDVVIYKIGQYQ
jgi:hypothetical protein